jgi:hypothetical protein
MLRVYELHDSLVESKRGDDGSCMLRASGTMNVLVTRTKLLIPQPLLLAARRRGDGLVCFALLLTARRRREMLVWFASLLTARRRGYRIVHSNSLFLEAMRMGNWLLHFMFLLPFSSSGGEGVGG